MADKPSPAAAEGTCAHTVAEHYVRRQFQLTGWSSGGAAPHPFPDGFDPKGKTIEEWNEELRRAGKGYCEYIVGLAGAAPDAYVVLEHKVAAPSIHEQLFGTADCLIWIASTRTLVVVDYKYGFAGVDVGTPDDPNKQLEAYAIAAIEQTGVQPDRVLLAVYQPRRHIGTPGLTLELPGSWLPAARERLAKEARLVDEAIEVPNFTMPVPGDHCRYCKASARCGAPNQFAVAALQAYVTPTSLHDMTDDEVVDLWSMRTAFKNFMEDVEERVGNLVKTGHKGLVLKTSQGRQMWIDGKTAGLTLLTLGRADLIQAVALGECLHAIPEEFREALVKRSAPSQTIAAVTKADPGAVAKMFDKYADKA